MALGLFLAALLLPHPAVALEDDEAEAAIAPEAVVSIGEAFAGEEVVYRVSFWIFKNVAVAKMSIRKESDDIYIATLEAETTGVAAWFREREDVYTATMKLVDGGSRFQTLRFDEYTKVGKKTTRRITTIDHENGVMYRKKWKRGELREEKEFIIKEGAAYDGPLTALYNFRYGVYGAIKRGDEYTIKTFPKKKKVEEEMHLSIYTVDEYKRQRRSSVESNYFVNALMDKELFGSRTGKLELVFDQDMKLLSGVAKDLILFGDVRGEVIKSQSRE
jgi:hypothetical protein